MCCVSMMLAFRQHWVESRSEVRRNKAEQRGAACAVPALTMNEKSIPTAMQPPKPYKRCQQQTGGSAQWWHDGRKGARKTRASKCMRRTVASHVPGPRQPATVARGKQQCCAAVFPWRASAFGERRPAAGSWQRSASRRPPRTHMRTHLLFCQRTLIIELIQHTRLLLTRH